MTKRIVAKRKTRASTTTSNGRLGHVSISMEDPLWLHPAEINGQIYRPVSEDDPEVIALAESIKKHGLREPIVITKEKVIISGHRRRMACILAGLKSVPCRRESISIHDPNFAVMLIEHNRQRVKTIDERFREEVATADPEEAYQALCEHRYRESEVSAKTIHIRGRKTRAEISAAKKPFLDAIEEVIGQRRDYWPLSDRQIHYALLNNPPLKHASKPGSRYANDEASYKSCCELLTRARLSGVISFNAIHDPTRTVTKWRCFAEPGQFVRKECAGFLKSYSRDLLQSQPNHIEIVGEKNTIESIINRVASEHCIPYTIGRGYCSIPPRHEMAERFRASGKAKLVLLVLSDFDPEGEDIAHSFARSMRDDFAIECVEAVKVALTREQIDSLELPPQMKAKTTSSRHDRFVGQHGDDVFELEAMPPDVLETTLRDEVVNVLDLDRFNAEVDAEKHDAAFLQTKRQTIYRMLAAIDGGAGG